MFCIANVRGGGEFGKEWHAQGIRDKKQNVIDDFIAAAEYLIDNKYTDANHLTLNGASNGGMLVTACANQRPDLFAAVVAEVPVTDMLRFQKFTCGVQWSTDYGNADKKGDCDFLIKYSPLHNIKLQRYPAILVTTTNNDGRVVPLHSYKYIAELQHQAGQDTIQDQRPFLLRVDTNVGHNIGLMLDKAIQLLVDIYSFIAISTNAKWKN